MGSLKTLRLKSWGNHDRWHYKGPPPEELTVVACGSNYFSSHQGESEIEAFDGASKNAMMIPIRTILLA